MHRDGVDWVLVLMVRRENVASGETTIYDLVRRPLGSFTLTAPLDSALADDGRAYHGVTPLAPLDPQRLAYRDVLVATSPRQEPQTRIPERMTGRGQAAIVSLSGNA